MSKPLNISQHANVAAKGVPTTGPQSAIQDSEGKLLRTSGCVGSFQAGGAVLETRAVVSLDLDNKTINLSADQLVGCDIFVFDAAAGVLQLPPAAEIVRYLGRISASPSATFAAASIVNSGNVSAPPAMPTPSALIPSFEFEIHLTNTDTASLAGGSGTEIRRGGLGNITVTATHALLNGGGANTSLVNRFRGYVLNASAASPVVAIVPLNEA